ncbi:MAG: 30S ribosomal protein S16 [Chitinispirillaceae bacterium]|nr:30S ribosomal protein S16 [Chitinispirillaceae bacterium]
MAVKIRLARTGRKKIACYRIVVADSRMKRDGRFLETIGTYEPQASPKKFQFKMDRAAYWLRQGAKPSETVFNLFKQDRGFEKIEALAKGLSLESLNLERLPERKRKPKPKPEKKNA